MSVEEYLQQNMKAELLKKADEFKSSSKYKAIRTITTSKKFKTAQAKLLQRDAIIHRTILDDIQKLQDTILKNS
ncbi:hypothetical protein [Sulfurimonas sp.]|uniref:hypothetical protein n=1 Tax=Sulfurimonas sp. TaxID=2022749 RepID=UPI0025DB5632|nr:hypothetical protein [Sulfurimonas sp.]MCK9453741.1 hypothetical protein [Sulfurimonas sp.]